jgi:hypothetical protein
MLTLYRYVFFGPIRTRKWEGAAAGPHATELVTLRAAGGPRRFWIGLMPGPLLRLTESARRARAVGGVAARSPFNLAPPR